jgi:hypothetical protein
MSIARAEPDVVFASASTVKLLRQKFPEMGLPPRNAKATDRGVPDINWTYNAVPVQ